MIPRVTVFSSPKGFPTAIAQSPTFKLSEFPNWAVGQGPFHLSLITARSVKESSPTTFPSTLLPSDKPTIN